ncbi:hypothetical protein BATDEDRAFT_12454 [Batrachochytrium dendrobatidis JAM81]|uniref:Dihydrofolate synthetase n=2 Tax=Batrachochytrium dendrobatidis TaxID=109871 RepID=F4P5E3_BATDJ|nr:uncharacterized protein BATDEDRAFT_12454 [Batrachochytrium dendrobatidis JAM81]EGF79180.1 hypothetical protein BATDEDRAFT_12454 [Batrachochytrium dendrobatidis JAM81]KAK5668106.1 folylpolyglutamate synthase [Batrachochytrium dendrobatidis]OAJ43824.1 hypothetical protein BDEG_27141 [Batrachochytrium dendrobatidis JEL423]|eukprot:XP_006679807.1 hypothetical protein BATDEDRAFT_12454 [Batrachochytrium dendrobatidis JAM81]
MAPVIQPGLERVRELLAELYNPHLGMPVVHVAGTNGKGSVCSYISSVLAATGLKTASFSSPHLLHPRDSIRINGQAITLQQYQSAHRQVQMAMKAIAVTRNNSPEQHQLPTASPFEQLVALMFLVIRQLQVDIVVLEVGLGGLLDATNIIPSPLVAVITAIGIDHTAFLGTTVLEIAAHKAGIFKPENCVAVIARQPQSNVQLLLEQYASAAQCQIHPLPSVCVVSSDGNNIYPSVSATFCNTQLQLVQRLPGSFQLDNIAAALAALESLVLVHNYTISASDVINGFDSVTCPGRLEWIQHPDLPISNLPISDPPTNRRVLLDGAHNPLAAAVLADYVNHQRNAMPSLAHVHWIVGFTSGKDIHNSLSCLVQPQDRVSVVPFAQPLDMPWIHSEDTRIIANVADTLIQGDTPSQCFDSFADAWNVITSSNTDCIVVICGSLYLVSEVYRTLHMTF